MKEDFLHHLWLYKRLDITQLQTTTREHLQILHFGHYLQSAGPDFRRTRRRPWQSAGIFHASVPERLGAV